MSKMKDLVCTDTPPAWVDNICDNCRSFDVTIDENHPLCRRCEEDVAWDEYCDNLYTASRES